MHFFARDLWMSGQQLWTYQPLNPSARLHIRVLIRHVHALCTTRAAASIQFSFPLWLGSIARFYRLNNDTSFLLSPFESRARRPGRSVTIFCSQRTAGISLSTTTMVRIREFLLHRFSRRGAATVVQDGEAGNRGGDEKAQLVHGSEGFRVSPGARNVLSLYHNLTVLTSTKVFCCLGGPAPPLRLVPLHCVLFRVGECEVRESRTGAAVAAWEETKPAPEEDDDREPALNRGKERQERSGQPAFQRDGLSVGRLGSSRVHRELGEG